MPKLSRRQWVRLAGAAAMTGLIGRAAGQGRMPSCVVRPRQTEGPYFLDERLERSDIRSDPTDGAISAGVPLELAFQVSRVGGSTCAPLAGAIVDVWQCNALGEYSGFDDFGGHFDARGRRFLRGYQITDANGAVRFTTIVPGWYPGRAVHIHFRIRTAPKNGRGPDFTSQLYFDEAIIDAVHAQAPYASKGRRRTANADDGIFRRGGRELILPLRPQGRGYSGTFDIGLEK